MFVTMGPVFAIAGVGLVSGIVIYMMESAGIEPRMILAVKTGSGLIALMMVMGLINEVFSATQGFMMHFM